MPSLQLKPAFGFHVAGSFQTILGENVLYIQGTRTTGGALPLRIPNLASCLVVESPIYG